MPSRIYEHYRADKIHVEVLDDKNELHTEMDGEIYGGGDQTITLLPNAIKLKI